MWSSRKPAFGLALAALITAAAAPALAQNESRYNLKPGAAGKLCLDCHTEFQEVARKAHVHTPVKTGQCIGCHSPHAAEHGKLLAASPDAVCATCHGSMIPEGAVSSHQAVVEGQCVSCHDPHASPNPANLKTAGNELCLSCHADLKAALQSAAHHHAPVDRDCLRCHDPHASKTSASLLRKPSPSICLECHVPTGPRFAQAHRGYPVGATDCASCHDPHGSSSRGILWANVHKPVGDRMCAQCHGDPAGSTVTVKRAGADLCRGCHNDLMLEIGAKNHVHAPVEDGEACLHCHQPHASKTAGLLLSPQKQLCGGCHADSIARQERSLTKHPPVNDGECTSCHQPHASDATLLFASADDKETCGACHDWSGHTAHPIGDKAVDQRNANLRVSCMSCHRSHGSPFKYFAHADVKGELCVQCHTQITR